MGMGLLGSSLVIIIPATPIPIHSLLSTSKMKVTNSYCGSCWDMIKVNLSMGIYWDKMEVR